jgi:predicted enzyme related to lactoylglutathione lyase
LRVSRFSAGRYYLPAYRHLAATLDRVASAGGACVFGPLTLPNDIGTIALFTDSEGNRVGLHQPA